MEEVEVKILEINVPEVIKKIESFGARKTFDGEVTSSFFDFSNDSLQKHAKDLRLRHKDDHYEFTFKHKVLSDGVLLSKEYEIKIDKDEDIRNILAGLGLMETSTNTKKRTCYRLDDVKFELDTMENWPTYLEVQAKEIETVMHWVEKLGFDKSQALSWTGRDVWDHYTKKLK